jgi:CRISPR type III-A-associated RAMP protein Csm4
MLIYIEPKSSFSLISSDSLYGALVNTLQILSADFDDILLELMENPLFLISSAFPFVQAQGNQPFLS